MRIGLRGKGSTEPAAPPREARMRVGEVASGFEVQAGIPDIDYLDALGFPEYLSEFRKVANDPQVAKELRANTLPLLSAEWKIEPASDEPRDVEIGEFAAANILGETGKTFGRQFWQSVAWKARLRDILRFLQNGFAVFQKVYRKEGRFWIFAKVKYLVPESIECWQFDERDNLTGLLRSYIDAQGKTHSRERIGAEDLIVYTWDQEGSNVVGRPFIRPMWGPYRMKSRLEKLEVIDKEKTAVGMPYFQLQENASPEDENRAEQLMKSMRSGNFERSYAVVKAGQDFGWKEGGRTDKGIRPIIAGKEEQMAKIGGTASAELDSSHSGWGGTAGARSAFESMLHTAIAEVVVEQEQRNVVELIDMNYPGVTAYPRLKVGRIDPFEKTRNIPQFVAAITAGGRGFDLDTENEIRRRYGFMERTEETPHPPAKGNADPEAKQTGRLRVRRVRLGDSADAVKRARMEPEKVRAQLEAFEAQYRLTLRSVLKDMLSAVIESLRDGRQPMKPGDVRVPFISELKDRLLAVLKNVRDFGRDELEAEIYRQIQHRAGRKGSIRLQFDPTTRRGAIGHANERAQVLVEIDVSGLIQRLQTLIVAGYSRLVSQGLGLNEILTNLERSVEESLFERQIERVARASAAAQFNEGRNITIQELKEELAPYVVRSAVMDERTCSMDENEPGDSTERCWELDGQTVIIESEDFRKFHPPAFCLGLEQCRCVYLAYPREFRPGQGDV